MAIAAGDRLPDGTFLVMGEDGPEPFTLDTAGRKVVIFGLPGPFTGTCTTAHVPSFQRTADDFTAKGVDAIYCVAVADPFVMKAWQESMGADKITFLADPSSDFTTAIGLNFTAPPVGFYDRSKRYSMLVEDGVVNSVNLEESPGTCDTSGGEALLETV
ncbi:peroxiredoxin [Pseudoroseicyclus tamaricis]|uniref:Glutathione-dependent peroxiredoxin n=1 Tax=Pseudoroseicyclus tamaricis TaxID=2705421 RepID=A0A6B2JYN8_9RHOB|nr:peroxiredoxin [Pseudoroseicyclus tamaricis]NDV02875.1 peroxiredoxin [Pseudoroseicyclus tamaricis]